MKHALRSIATAITLSLMFTVLATSIFAASVPVTEYVYYNWRGNGSTSGRNVDDETMAIGKGQKVRFSAQLTLTVDPKTDEHKVTSTAALRQCHWYGYSTLTSLKVFNELPMSNSSKTTFYRYSAFASGSATTTATGDYYIVANTSGASSAFYNNYAFTTVYEVGK